MGRMSGGYQPSPQDLRDGEVIQPSGVTTPEQRERAARRRAAKIRQHLEDAARVYAEAVLAEDWRTLGYDSVAAWTADTLGVERFTVEARRQVAELLAAGGRTVRETAAATGTSVGTAAGDVRACAQKLNTTEGNPRQRAARKRERTRPRVQKLNTTEGQQQPAMRDDMPAPACLECSGLREQLRQAQERNRRLLAENQRLEGEAETLRQRVRLERAAASEGRAAFDV